MQEVALLQSTRKLPCEEHDEVSLRRFSEKGISLPTFFCFGKLRGNFEDVGTGAHSRVVVVAAKEINL